jgi:3-deoxy-manno-octulosonate cytidylyltransferase (CMP-KDO synthetase)
LAKEADHVVVATCDTEIMDCIQSFGGRAIMTSSTHERCTDRVEEAMKSLPGDIVVMVQGDEPLLRPDAIAKVAKPLLDDPSLEVVNLLSPLESENDYVNPNIVKAACDINQNLIYLTRSPIPYFRKTLKAPVFRQTGIMAFRAGFLTKFSSLPETALEIIESVDMLRLIEHGIRIKGVVVDYETNGVDLPSDIAIIESILSKNSIQKLLFEKINNP